MEASKADLRETLNGFTVVLVVGLTLAVIGVTWSLLTAGYFLLLGGMGFALAQLLALRGVDVPVPRGLRRRWSRGTYRHAAADQPFNTRIGWTSGSEPGGSLPDARRVVPQGNYGVGHMTDTTAGLLIIVALVFSAFRYGSPLAAFLLFGVLGLAGFTLLRLVRWLRQR